jgi:hypothetical protein
VYRKGRRLRVRNHPSLVFETKDPAKSLLGQSPLLQSSYKLLRTPIEPKLIRAPIEPIEIILTPIEPARISMSANSRGVRM